MNRTMKKHLGILLASVLGGVLSAQAQTDNPAPTPPPAASSNSATPAPAHKTSPFRAQKMSSRAKELYSSNWGVDRLKVTRTASGNLIRFSYRVIEPKLAKPLGEKATTPYLLEPRSGAQLQIPVMDKVGALRQSGAPIAGKEYWMTFSNKGNYVKVGDRVNVVIGSFHADGLMVE